MNTSWSRRRWLTSQALGLAALAPRSGGAVGRLARPRARRVTPAVSAARQARVAQQAERLDPVSWAALAQRAVDAAHAAGASYAEARLTRQVNHFYDIDAAMLTRDEEWVGVGVRALVKGYWGFSASAVITPDEVVWLAQNAAAQAQENAKGTAWPVELGTIPVATGQWATPVRIDPFTVSIEEKSDFITYWKDCCHQVGLSGGPSDQWGGSFLLCAREEQVVATSEGAHFTQTLFETGGKLLVCLPNGGGGVPGLFGLLGGGGGLDALVNAKISVPVHGIDMAGAGWERFLDAKIPEQFLSGRLGQELAVQSGRQIKKSLLGKYTLVCDGATMAALVEATLGVATQLDRALGYEANASGTSWIDDPLGMVGTAQVAAPSVTLTANRSAPQELATVKWDAEGVEPAPAPFPLIKDGVLVDFQTTREQAAWLAPYYQKQGRPVTSHGCAMADSAHVLPLQQMPNLALAPNAAAVRLEDLVADVPAGILVERGSIRALDFQGRTGLLGEWDQGQMREIKNGRAGKQLVGGQVFFNTQTLWKAITALGGPATEAVLNKSRHFNLNDYWFDKYDVQRRCKGEPAQLTSHTVRAVAATIPNQPVIDPWRKG